MILSSDIYIAALFLGLGITVSAFFLLMLAALAIVCGIAEHA